MLDKMGSVIFQQQTRSVQGVAPAALTRRSRSASQRQDLFRQDNRRRLGVVDWLLLGWRKSCRPSPELPRRNLHSAPTRVQLLTPLNVMRSVSQTMREERVLLC